MVVFTAGETLVVPCEYMLVDGISNNRNRGSYSGAHSFSTIGNFIGPTLGGAILGAFGGPGMFLLFAGFAAISAILFAVGTPCRPRKQRHSNPRRVRRKLLSGRICATRILLHESCSRGKAGKSAPQSTWK